MSSSAWRAAPAIASNVSAVALRVVREPLAGGGLDDHHADRVGDDVVQLGGDPRALVADRERGVGLALLLELARALGERRGDLVALAQAARRRPSRRR